MKTNKTNKRMVKVDGTTSHGKDYTTFYIVSEKAENGERWDSRYYVSEQDAIDYCEYSNENYHNDAFYISGILWFPRK